MNLKYWNDRQGHAIEVIYQPNWIPISLLWISCTTTAIRLQIR